MNALLAEAQAARIEPDLDDLAGDRGARDRWDTGDPTVPPPPRTTPMTTRD